MNLFPSRDGKALALFLFLSLFASSGFSEILVYKSSVNRWSSSLITEGTKTRWVTAPRGTQLDAYAAYDLDGTNKILPATLMTNRGKIFKPTLIYVDHKLKTKQLRGQTQAKASTSTEQYFYGRARGPGGQRMFRIFYQQWAPNGDGSYDTSVSMGEGLCQVLNVGGGKSGYYAPKLAGQGWRMDGWFNGPVSPFQDGRQFKSLTKSDSLDLPLTQAINNQSLTISQAYAYVIENLLPSYTLLDTDVR